jgi:hypothetical protein
MKVSIRDTKQVSPHNSTEIPCIELVVLVPSRSISSETSEGLKCKCQIDRFLVKCVIHLYTYISVYLVYRQAINLVLTVHRDTAYRININLEVI